MRPGGRRHTGVSQKMEGILVWERDHDYDDYAAVAAAVDVDDDDDDEDINVFSVLKVDEL